MNKQNILELLGGNKRKYHSCVISSFSFDFNYFETRLLPTLRVLNINNTIILADGNYLEYAQEQCIGEEFKPHRGYSFHGVYTKGVFHPKILFLTGEKDGLLLIGSGNITSSGLNGNDEIWAAFQFNTKEENKHAPIFKEVWNYLKSFESNLLGASIQKLHWVEEYTPWLTKLPTPSGWIEKNTYTSIRFIGNSSTKSTISQLMEYVPQNSVENIQVVAPFYDLKGELLIHLIEHYQPQLLQCFVDQSFESLPYQLDKAYHDKIQFYDWSDSYEVSEDEKVKKITRLHAKLVQIKLSDGTTYLYFGSANASIPAFGENGKSALNEEAGLLIKQSNKDFIKELGIEANHRKSIIDYTPPSNLKHQNNKIFKSIFYFRLKYAEAKGDKISIKLDDKIRACDCQLFVFDKFDNQIEKISFTTEKEETIFITSQLEDVFKVQAIEIETNRTSNFALVHHADTFFRSNPQQKNSKLHQLLNGEIENYSSLEKLMSYLSSNWGEFQNERKDSKINIRSHGADEPKEVKNISQEEFMTPSEKSLLKQLGVSSSPTNLILQFLQSVRAHLHDQNIESGIEEEELTKDESERGNDVRDDLPETEGEKADYKKTLSYNTFIISKLDKQYDKILYDYLKSKDTNKKIEFKITEEEIKHLLIVLEVIMLNYDQEEESEDSKKPNIKLRLLLNGKLNQKEFGLKKFLMTTVSKFLLIANNNIVTESDDISIARMKQFKASLMSYILFITFNMSWLPDEEKYKNNLILNTLHTLKIGDDIKSYQSIFNQLDKYLDEIKFLDRDILQEIKYLRKITLPKYLAWNNEKRKPLNEITDSDIIFSTSIGFYHLVNKRANLNFDFKRVGYDYQNGDFLWTNINMGKNEVREMVLF
ncbi:hypothetical protein [Flammeovirga sp. OC4]|uniref:hypothetical protein n=1 Tax=Flammeovirga sp. OC4 TaxID=1382345 RepID=UPI0005C69B4F|nr:hypothetical protein [Flammeovirga sp. OC4]